MFTTRIAICVGSINRCSARRRYSIYSVLNDRIAQFLGDCENSHNKNRLRRSLTKWSEFRSMTPLQQAQVRTHLDTGQLIGSEIDETSYWEQQWAQRSDYPTVPYGPDPVRNVMLDLAHRYASPGITIWEGGSGTLDFLILVYFSLIEQGIQPRAAIGSDINTFFLRKGMGFVRYLESTERIGAIGYKAEAFPHLAWVDRPSLLMYKDLFAVLHKNHVLTLLSQVSTALADGSIALFNFPLMRGSFYQLHEKAYIDGQANCDRLTDPLDPESVWFASYSQGKQFSRNFFSEGSCKSLLKRFGLKEIGPSTVVDQRIDRVVAKAGSDVPEVRTYVESHQIVAVARR